MAQRDYVSRSRNNNNSRKSNGKKKSRKNKSAGASITMRMVAFSLLLLFISGLYYLKTNKNQKPVRNKHRQERVLQLPPKPETRWIYRNKLENPHSTPLPIPQKNSEQNLSSKDILTEEQRLLLSQIKADMRNPDVALPGTYNQQVATPKSELLDKTPTPQRNNQSSASLSNNTLSTPSTMKNQKSEWHLQCGAFRNTEQAESIRAALALVNISTRIQRNGDWHRVILGPYMSKEQIVKQLPLIESVGIKGCIFIFPRG